MFTTLHLLRAITACLIVLNHLSYNVAKPKYWGSDWFIRYCSIGHVRGVCLFFVLSGFLITYLHRKDWSQPGVAGAFLYKRFVRILPMYWLVFVTVYLGSLLVPGAGDGHALPPQELARSMALLPQDANLVGGTGAPVLAVAWTLQYEVLFYLMIFCFILNVYVGAAATVVGFLWFSGVCDLPLLPDTFRQNVYIPIIALGVLGSWMVQRPAPGRMVAAVMAVAGLLIFLSTALFNVDSIPVAWRSILIAGMGIGAFLLVTGGVQLERSGVAIPLHRCLKSVGDASFSIYLTHFPMLALLCKVFRALLGPSALAMSVSVVLIFAMIIGFALLVHQYIERPLLECLRMNSKEKRKAEPARSADAVPAFGALLVIRHVEQVRAVHVAGRRPAVVHQGDPAVAADLGSNGVVVAAETRELVAVA